MKNYKYLLFVSTILATNNAWADISCTTISPDKCTEMGYTLTTTDCASKPTIKCPFDTSKVWCTGLDTKACAPGDFLDKDMNCWGYIPNGIDIIGVMFTNDLAVEKTITYNPKQGSTCNVSPKIQTHHPAGAYGVWPSAYASGYTNTSSCTLISPTGSSPERYHCYGYYPVTDSGHTVYRQNTITDYCHPRGKEATDFFAHRDCTGCIGCTIVYSGCTEADATNKFALQACYNKTTSGVPAHMWFVPAIGDLLHLQTNLAAVNSGLTLVGGDTIPASGSNSCGLNRMLSSSLKEANDWWHGGSSYQPDLYVTFETPDASYSGATGNVRCIISREIVKYENDENHRLMCPVNEHDLDDPVIGIELGGPK